MLKIDRDQLQTALKHLEQAIYNHAQWHKELIRTMICGLPCDQRDVADDAHRRCRFGQWYHTDVPGEFRDQQSFLAIGVEHKHMHMLAAQLLRVSATGSPINPGDYDRFANTLERLRLEIDTLVHEIQEALYDHDPLTGAGNRVSMLTRLRELQEMVNRNVQECCIAIMDLDFFKAINDTYGHPVGDQVLCASAQYVMEHLRPYDKVFRYGGEEFLISMPNTNLPLGTAVLDRVRDGLGLTVLAHQGSNPVSVTACFGITLLEPDITVEQSIQRADTAMYAAKGAGRNCVRAWDSSLQNP